MSAPSSGHEPVRQPPSLVWLRHLHEDDGNAIVEFVYLAILLMVPLVYLLLTVFRVQGAAYAVSSASREAGRVFVTSAPGDADARAATAAAIVMNDSGLALEAGQLNIRCSARPCLTPGSNVEVKIGYEVALPFLPRFLDGSLPASIHVEGRHLEVVDRFRPAPR
jgi:Flp pilus assembly protein TadG